MSDEKLSGDSRRLLEYIAEWLEGLRRTHPDEFAAVSNAPDDVALWLFVVWVGVCGKPPIEPLGELSRLIETLERYRKGLASSEGGGGVSGRSKSKQTEQARTLKALGRSMEEICQAVIPNYLKLNPVRRQEEKKKLRDRMRKQRGYEKRTQGRDQVKGRGRRRELHGEG